MRPALLLTALLAGCYHTSSDHQALGWAIKAGVSAASAPVSKKLLGNVWLGPIFMCGLFLGYEYEDTRGLKRFQSGKVDSAMDATSGCVPGISVGLALR